MQYPFEHSKKCKMKKLTLKEGETKFFFPHIVSEKYVRVLGCEKNEWKVLFFSTLKYCVLFSKRKMYFEWNDEDIKSFKVKDVKDLLIIEELKKYISGNELIFTRSLFDTLNGKTENDCFIKNSSTSVRQDKLSPDNPSCISLKSSGKVFYSVSNTILKKDQKSYVEKNLRYASAHGFEYVVFSMSSKRIRNVSIENLSKNTQIDDKTLTSKICVLLEKEVFEDIRDVISFFRKNKNISIVIDSEDFQENLYYYVKKLISKNIDIACILVPYSSDISVKLTTKLCKENSISVVRKISHSFILNEENSKCFLFKKAISEEITSRVFKKLLKRCTIRYPIKVYDKETITPRTQLLFADSDIKEMKYSSVTIPSIKWKEYIEEIKEMVIELASRINLSFSPNSCLVNGYILKTDCVGAHRDRIMKDSENIVCTVSVGGSRDFIFKNYSTKELISKTILENGDVVFMTQNTNLTTTHEISKYKLSNGEFKERFSLTFREI